MTNETKTEQTHVDWHELAVHYAQLAYLTIISGAWATAVRRSHPDVLIVFDNQPRPGQEALTELGWRLIRRLLREQGLSELAFATHAAGSFDRLGASVMLIQVGDEKMDELLGQLDYVRDYVSEMEWADYVLWGRVLPSGDCM